MMRRVWATFGVLLALVGPAGAQSVSNPNGGSAGGTTNTSVSVPSVAPSICQGGTGSTVASVGVTATTVCLAGTVRSYWRIANNAGAGAGYVYCTDDGSVPTLTHWTFPVYSQGFQDTTGMQNVSPSSLSCIAAAATAITAQAVQTGAAP